MPSEMLPGATVAREANYVPRSGGSVAAIFCLWVEVARRALPDQAVERASPGAAPWPGTKPFHRRRAPT